MAAPATSVSTQLDQLENRLKESALMIQFHARMRELRDIGAQLDRKPTYEAARFFFLSGVLFTKAARAEVRDRPWPLSSTESLCTAMEKFIKAIDVIHDVQQREAKIEADPGKNTRVQQHKLLEQRSAYEWIVAYSILNNWRAELPARPSMIFEPGILGVQTLRQVKQQLRSRKIIDSKMR